MEEKIILREGEKRKMRKHAKKRKDKTRSFKSTNTFYKGGKMRINAEKVKKNMMTAGTCQQDGEVIFEGKMEEEKGEKMN